MIKSTFDFIKLIQNQKPQWNTFSPEEKEKFNAYVVHRTLSMNPSYVMLVNEVQELNPQNFEGIYNVYREFIPKGGRWFKYLKSSTKDPNKELVSILASHFQISSREIKDYLKIMSKDDIKDILVRRGYDDKEIKKLLK